MVKAVDPQIELVPADFQTPYAECSHMYFTGVGGARIHAKLLRPKKASKPHPAVLMFHGYTGSSGEWVDKLGYVAMGYTVAALDCSARAVSPRTTVPTRAGPCRRPYYPRLGCGARQKLYFRQMYLDTAQLAKIVLDMPDVDPSTRVGAMGGSRGGGLTLACVGLEPRIQRAAPVFPHLPVGLPRTWEIDQAKDAWPIEGIFPQI